jgi:hypothetical protein
MKSKQAIPTLDQAAKYQLQVIGRLDSSWSEHFGGMDLTASQREDGITVTTLTGMVTDQANLHGVLQSIRDLGLPLLSVECIE